MSSPKHAVAEKNKSTTPIAQPPIPCASRAALTRFLLPRRSLSAESKAATHSASARIGGEASARHAASKVNTADSRAIRLRVPVERRPWHVATTDATKYDVNSDRRENAKGAIVESVDCGTRALIRSCDTVRTADRALVIRILSNSGRLSKSQTSAQWRDLPIQTDATRPSSI